MIRVVVDTNAVVSANLRDEGFSALILDLATNGKILMFVSEQILREYEEVLLRPRLKLDRTRVRNAPAVIGKTSELINVGNTLTISSDESDNRFYECAAAAKAHFLITGNTKHFPMHHKFTQVVTPRESIERLGLALQRKEK